MSNCVAAESKAFVLGLKQEVAQADVSGEEEESAPVTGLSLFCLSSHIVLAS